MKKSYLLPLILVIIILGLLIAIILKGAMLDTDNSNPRPTEFLHVDVTAGPDTGEDKIFRFSFSNNGYSIEAGYGSSESLSGIRYNYLSKPYIAKSKATTTIGFLKIINSYVPENIDINQVFAAPLKIERNRSILIYHVHALEGFCANKEDKKNLTVNEIPGNQNNVVYLGDVMKEVIEQNTSLSVIRNATVFDRTGGSNETYLRALPMLNQVVSEYPDTGLIIDVHRNAIDVTREKYGPVVTYNNVDYAPISFVLGMDWSYDGDRDDSVNPYWEDNLKLIMLVAKKMEDRVPGIVDNIGLRRNPYNQNVAANTLLVEIGFDGNLTSEAEATARLLAEIIGEIYG